jgi:hypothetical protein
VSGSNAAAAEPAMLAVISSAQVTPLTSASAVSQRASRANADPVSARPSSRG